MGLHSQALVCTLYDHGLDRSFHVALCENQYAVTAMSSNSHAFGDPLGLHISLLKQGYEIAVSDAAHARKLLLNFVSRYGRSDQYDWILMRQFRRTRRTITSLRTPPRHDSESRTFIVWLSDSIL